MRSRWHARPPRNPETISATWAQPIAVSIVDRGAARGHARGRHKETRGADMPWYCGGGCTIHISPATLQRLGAPTLTFSHTSLNASFLWSWKGSYDFHIFSPNLPPRYNRLGISPALTFGRFAKRSLFIIVIIYHYGRPAACSPSARRSVIPARFSSVRLLLCARCL